MILYCTLLRLFQNLMGHYTHTGIILESNLHFRLIQSKLTPNLGSLALPMQDELDFGVDVDFPTCKGKHFDLGQIRCRKFLIVYRSLGVHKTISHNTAHRVTHISANFCWSAILPQRRVVEYFSGIYRKCLQDSHCHAAVPTLAPSSCISMPPVQMETRWLH
jgi:hypothetical protein